MHLGGQCFTSCVTQQWTSRRQEAELGLRGQKNRGQEAQPGAQGLPLKPSLSRTPSPDQPPPALPSLKFPLLHGQESLLPGLCCLGVPRGAGAGAEL